MNNETDLLPCLECMERDRCRDGMKCLSRWNYEQKSGYDEITEKVRKSILEESKRIKERSE